MGYPYEWTIGTFVLLMAAGCAATWLATRRLRALAPVAAPKRRWFAFSLRGLFIALTALALVTGWVKSNLDWIRERHEFLDDYGPVIEPPGQLWLFGEWGTNAFSLQFYTDPNDGRPRRLRPDEVALIKKAERLFPESQILWVLLHGGKPDVVVIPESMVYVPPSLRPDPFTGNVRTLDSHFQEFPEAPVVAPTK